VSVGIWVREESTLEDWVGRWLKTRYEMGWVVSSLLDLGEVVLDVSVESQLSELAKRELGVWPDLGEIEDVVLELLGLLRSHGLNVDLPLGVITTLNSLEEILGSVVWGGTSEFGSLLLGKELYSLLGEKVDLGVYPCSILVDKLEGVSRVSLHLSVTIGDTTVSEEPHDLVDRLWVVGEVVPEHSGIGTTVQVSLRIALLGVDEVRELCGVSDEEDRSVVEYPVHVALSGLELDGESSRVSSGIGRSRLSSDGRESDGDRALKAFLRCEVGKTDVGQALCALEDSVSTSSLGVYNSLWNSFSVEVGEEID